MTNKEECARIMKDLFGPISADMVNNMTEDNCVEQCKKKVMAFLGPKRGKLFDGIGGH